jgi:hypothetical protein
MDAKMPDLSLQRIFSAGHEIEAVFMRTLSEAGVQIVQQQRPLSWPAFQLTGSIDGMVPVPPDGVLAPMDVKSASKFSFEKVRRMSSAADLLGDRREYMAGYVTQIALYCLLLEKPVGYLFFICKDSYESHTITVSLDDPREQRPDAVRAGQRCDHGRGRPSR